MMGTSATTSGRGLGPPGDDRSGSAPPLQGALGPDTSPSRRLTDPAALAGTRGHRSIIRAVRHRIGGISDARRSAIPAARADSLVGCHLRRGSWRSLSSSSLSSSCWQSPGAHCWPCATLQRLTSSPQEPIQLTSRARSQTPARAPPRHPHPGTPKTNRRRLGNPPRLRLARRVTTLRTSRSSGSWTSTDRSGWATRGRPLPPSADTARLTRRPDRSRRRLAAADQPTAGKRECPRAVPMDDPWH